jgi:transcriptional antiterminator Rof (Rho-off)
LPDSRLSFTVSDFAKTLIDDADASTARTTLGAQASDATLTSLSGLSLAAGDVLYATAADTLARLPKGTAAQILAMNAGATAPEWVAPSGAATTDASLLTTGTLDDARLSFAVSAFAKTLLDDTDAADTRTTLGAQASDATLTSLSGLALAAGDVLYATAADTLARLPKGTAAQVLAMNAGATAPEWVAPSGVATTDASLLTSGTLADARLSFAVSAFAKTLLDDTDAAAFRTTASLYSQAEQDARYANLISPALTGTPTAPTAAAATNTTQIATTAMVQAAIAAGPAGSTDASLLTSGTLADARLSFAVSAFAKTLLDDADAVDTRTTLGAQASDATLTSLSGLSLAAGDVLYATAADTLARLPKGTAAQVLAMNAGATAPEWSTSTGQTNESLAHGAIGQYCFASTSATNTAITPGSTYAGSGLRAAGYNALDNATQPRMEKSATALTGTWRALGYAPATVTWYSVAMFVRIS